ncbi:MAG: hypothetical protein QG597_4970 [Actinomycetota bacterium]|jgi:hypothetical protein|nr:hypothetical protein [Actinomycetota bacterium]
MRLRYLAAIGLASLLASATLSGPSASAASRGGLESVAWAGTQVSNADRAGTERCSKTTRESQYFGEVCRAAESGSEEALLGLCLESRYCRDQPSLPQMTENWRSATYRDALVKAMNASDGGLDLQVAPKSGWNAAYCTPGTGPEIPWRWRENVQQLRQDARRLGFNVPRISPKISTCPRFYKGPAVFVGYDSSADDYGSLIGTFPWGTHYDVGDWGAK